MVPLHVPRRHYQKNRETWVCWASARKIRKEEQNANTVVYPGRVYADHVCFAGWLRPGSRDHSPGRGSHRHRAASRPAGYWTGVGRQRSLADRGGWYDVFHLSAPLCLQLQRLLPAVDHRSVAADGTWRLYRTALALLQRGLGLVLGWRVLSRQYPACHLLRRGPGQRDSRRVAQRAGLLLRGSVDGL